MLLLLSPPPLLSVQLTAVHLVDSHHCSDPAKFLSAAFLSLTAMIRLECPHVNVLSKMDLIESCGAPAFGLDFYTEVSDVMRLARMTDADKLDNNGDHPFERVYGMDDADDAAAATGDAHDSEAVLDSNSATASAGGRTGATGRPSFAQRYRRFNEKIAEILEDHNLVSFVPISLQVSLPEGQLDSF